MFRRRMVGLLLLCACFVSLQHESASALVLVPGYTELTVGGSFSATQWQMTVDPDTGDIYTAENLNGVLRKTDSAGVQTLVTRDFTAGTGFFPYFYTDIEYHNGAVYTVSSAGEILETNVVTGVARVLATVPGVRFEAGTSISASGNELLITDGTGGANSMFTYNLTTGIVTKIGDVSTAAYGLEVGPDGSIYYADAGRDDFFKFSGGVSTLVYNGSGYSSEFAIAPFGSLYAVRDSFVDKIDVNTGIATPFWEGDLSIERSIAFGLSSSGRGRSLYITDGSRPIIEISGIGVPMPEVSTAAMWILGAVAGLGLLMGRRGRI